MSESPQEEKGNPPRYRTPTTHEMKFLNELEEARKDAELCKDNIFQKHTILLREYNAFISKHSLVIEELEKERSERAETVSRLQSVERKRTQLEALCRCLQSKNKQLRTQTKDLKTLELKKDTLEEGMFPQFKERLVALKERIADGKLLKSMGTGQAKKINEDLQLFIEQSQLREEHVVKLLDAKSLEVQIYAAKLESKEHKIRTLTTNHDILAAKHDKMEQTVKSLEQKIRKIEEEYTQRELCNKEALKKDDIRLNMQIAQTLEWVLRYNTLGQTLAKTTDENIVYRKKVEEKDNQIAAMAEMLRKLQRERLSMRQKLDSSSKQLPQQQQQQQQMNALYNNNMSKLSPSASTTSLTSTLTNSPSSNNLEKYSRASRSSDPALSPQKTSGATFFIGQEQQSSSQKSNNIPSSSSDPSSTVPDKEVEDMLEKVKQEVQWHNEPDAASLKQPAQHNKKSKPKKKKKKGKKK